MGADMKSRFRAGAKVCLRQSCLGSLDRLVAGVGAIRSGASRSSSPAMPTSAKSNNAGHRANDLAVRRALEAAGVEIIDENGGGPGVRLRKRHQKKS